MKYLFGGVAAVALIIVLALGVIYSGAYNVAASAPHFGIVSWVMHTTKHASVERQASAVDAPNSFSEDQAVAGARGFAQSCAHCHGAPGAEPAAWSQGLLPEPPSLDAAAEHWRPSQLFWIVRNGIKMTGMPAFGESYEDREIWEIVAFLEDLPNVSAERYRDLNR